jgi:tetratricopeptide (TPR) repeat protein
MAHDSDVDDLGAIDKLLAETDQGWDVEAQVRTLKLAAATKPLAEQGGGAGGSPASRHRLPMPTPFELAPAEVEATTQAIPTLRIGKAKLPSKAPPAAARRKGPPPLPRGNGRAPEPSPPSARAHADMLQPGMLIELLHARIATLRGRDDKVGVARAHMEMAVASEAVAGSDADAAMHAQAALKANPNLASAHSMLRRKKHARSALPEMLAHLEQELLAATSDAHQAALLVEKARLLDAIGDRSTEARSTWERALAHAPNHAGALKGLEAELVARARVRGAPADWEDWELLAVHLGRMAEAYGSDTRLAAWLHVERARVLERKLGRLDAARVALERALQLDPSVGPVRAALVRHLATYADWAGLARLLEEEARIEDSGVRAARLELDAAAIAAVRLADRVHACALLEQAAARAPTAAGVDRRVLDELVRLYEIEGRWPDAARARRARIRFLSDPATVAYELRSLAIEAEKGGDLEAAIADVQRALVVDAKDPTLAHALDRLLKATHKHEQRIAVWLHEAARTEDGVPRARALARAATVCDELGRRADAIRHLRSAWIAAPGDGEILDALARQLAPALPDAADVGPRALVDLYAQAAEHAGEVGRKIAFLERVGLLWEELLGDPARAARAYEQVLELDADRRSALLGLERTAARMGDARALARALLDEARLAIDGPAQLALRARAAGALADLDPARAMQLAREVLDRDPAHAAARALETQLEQQAGRWEMAAKSLGSRIDLATTPAEQVALWLALAQVQKTRLHRPLEAMASLERAWALDPAHPVPPEEIARVMEDHGDARALRDAIERIAGHAATPEDRARHLARAAEIDELRLGDDAAAIRTLQRALAEAPADDLVAERLARIVARHAQRAGGGDLGELATLLGKRIERATSPDAVRSMSFELAALLVEVGREPARATSLLEAALSEHVDPVPALRTLESLRRRAGELMPLARVLDQQGERFTDARARLGALWNLAALEEWKLPVGDTGATYRRILDLDPSDPGALEAMLRRELGDARSGDPRALQTVLGALRALVPLASDDDTRLTLGLLLALILERAAADAPEARASDDLAREALGRYRDALRIDEVSVTASTGVARLAGRFRDTEAALAAARSLAEIAALPQVRARYLVDTAELLLSPDDDERLGPRPERRMQAASILERALEADPDSIAAAGRLAGVLLEDHLGERVVSAFRTALARATSPETAVMIGSEIARVARDELGDLTVAVDAMRRVRAAAPQHIPSLLTLAELCIAQRAWPEAIDALETVASTAHDVPPKLTALFALASIYEKVLTKPGDADRVLRAALAADPNSARAIGGLLRRLAAELPGGDDAAQRARRTEIADLLRRLASLEKGAEQKTGILIELADVKERLGDRREAERALVEAVATSPSNAHAFARLAALFQHPGAGRDEAGHARALAAVIALGQQHGAVDARWFAALGQLQVQSLSRTRDGIAHLERASALDPTLYETRFELGCAYERIGAHEEATRMMIGMLTPAARPLLSIAKPGAALALLEKTLSADGRADEALVVTELRALAGELSEPEVGKLSARRPPPLDPQSRALDRSSLVTQVLPIEGRHVLLEVAAAIAGVEAKILRSDLAEIGVSSRDRITSRERNPMRALLDRLARQLGVGEVELAVTPGVVRTRVLAQDVPWIVVPRAMLELPESARAASLARALARIAFGVPWLEELPPPHIEALLVAAARQVVPGYGAEDPGARAPPLVAQFESSLARALSRRQRKLLEELAPHIASPQQRPIQVDTFVGALVRAELRAAFLVTGDLLALVSELRPLDAALYRATEAPGPQALIAVLEHPFAADLARFALTPEATALRRRVRSTWTTIPA